MDSEKNLPALPNLGSVVMRTEKAGVRLICDAVAIAKQGWQETVLMISGAGPESSVKAVAAGLRSNARVEFVISHPDLPYCNSPRRCEDGYKVYQVRLQDNYWHILLIADKAGFLPILDDESLWQELRSERYTTPLLRDWVPWIRDEMARREFLVELKQAGCGAGLVVMTTDDLDSIVSDGIGAGLIEIPEAMEVPHEVR